MPYVGGYAAGGGFGGGGGRRLSGCLLGLGLLPFGWLDGWMDEWIERTYLLELGDCHCAFAGFAVFGGWCLDVGLDRGADSDDMVLVCLVDWRCCLLSHVTVHTIDQELRSRSSDFLCICCSAV